MTKIKSISKSIAKGAMLLNSSAVGLLLIGLPAKAEDAQMQNSTRVTPLTVQQAESVQRSAPKEVPKPGPANQEDLAKKNSIPTAQAPETMATQSAPIGAAITSKSIGPKALSVNKYYDGQSATQNSPPDTTGAIGPNSFIQTVNTAARIYNRSGGVIGSGTLNNLAGYTSGSTGGPNSFDPQIIWDPTTNRFFYTMDSVFSSKDNRLAFGWSKTANPSNLTTDWCHYQINEGSRFPDYPKLGDAKGFIEIGVNAFGSSFLGSDLFVVNKPAAGTTCPSGPTFGVFRNVKDKDGRLIFTPVPSNSIDDQDNGFVVARNLSLPATKLAIFEVRKTSTGFSVFTKSVNVWSYDVPINASQPTYTQVIDTSDARPTQALQAFDPNTQTYSLFTQHTIRNGTNSSYIRWYVINPVPSNPVLLKQGNIGEANTFAYNASISPDRRKDGGITNYGRSFGLTFNVSSKTNNISPRIHVCFAPNGNNLTCGYLQNAIGPYRDFTCPKSGDLCRWGDYSAITPDPKATGTYGTLWGTNQWSGLANPSTGNANFRTKFFTVNY